MIYFNYHTRHACASTGEGLKDAILWESILEHCQRNNIERIIFISNNSNDFGKGRLEANLLEQMKEVGKDVIYYNSLDEFINSEFATITDLELKPADLDESDLKLLVSSEIPSVLNLESLYQRLSSSDARYSDYQGIYSLKVVQVNNLVVKDIDANFKYIHATLLCNAELVLVCERYRPFTNQITGDFDYDYDLDLETIPVTLNVEISMKKGDEEELEELQINKVNEELP